MRKIRSGTAGLMKVRQESPRKIITKLDIAHAKIEDLEEEVRELKDFVRLIVEDGTVADWVMDMGRELLREDI